MKAFVTHTFRCGYLLVVLLLLLLLLRRISVFVFIIIIVAGVVKLWPTKQANQTKANLNKTNIRSDIKSHIWIGYRKQKNKKIKPLYCTLILHTRVVTCKKQGIWALTRYANNIVVTWVQVTSCGGCRICCGFFLHSFLFFWVYILPFCQVQVGCFTLIEWAVMEHAITANNIQVWVLIIHFAIVMRIRTNLLPALLLSYNIFSRSYWGKHMKKVRWWLWWGFNSSNHSSSSKRDCYCCCFIFLFVLLLCRHLCRLPKHT